MNATPETVFRNASNHTIDCEQSLRNQQSRLITARWLSLFYGIGIGVFLSAIVALLA